MYGIGDLMMTVMFMNNWNQTCTRFAGHWSRQKMLTPRLRGALCLGFFVVQGRIPVSL